MVSITDLDGAYGHNNPNSSNNILLNKRTSEEFYQYGKNYYDESTNIINSMPTLPSKY